MEENPSVQAPQIQPETEPIVPMQKPPRFFQKMPFLIGAIVCLLVVGAGGFFLAQKGVRIVHKASVTGMPTPSPTPNPTADWKTYTDPDNRFSFKYPPGWITLIISHSNNVLVTTPDIAAQAKAKFGYSGACHPDYPILISEITEQFYNDDVYNFANKSYQKVTTANITVGGFQTTSKDIQMNFKPCGNSDRFINIDIPVNGRYYQVQFAYIDGLNNEQNKTIFTMLLNSLQFQNIPTPTMFNPAVTSFPQTTYTDKYYNYSIAYPNTWIFRRTYGPDIPKGAPTDILSGMDLTYNIGSGNNIVTQATIVVNVLDGHGYTDIEKWIDAYDLNYPKNATRTSVTFAGHPALKYEDNEPTRTTEYFYFLAGKYAYRVTAWQDPVISNAATDILNSFTP